MLRKVVLVALFAPGVALLWSAQELGAAELGLSGITLLLAAVAVAVARPAWFSARRA